MSEIKRRDVESDAEHQVNDERKSTTCVAMFIGNNGLANCS